MGIVSASAIAGFWRFFSAAVIALIVSASSTLHLPVLHLGTAAMGIVSGILYLVTLLGVDYSEFLRNNEAAQLQQTESEKEPLMPVDVTAAQKYGTDFDQRGN